MLKPQKIKDQEFPIKFKGYDPIEVRNYLEIVADNFFELEEHNRVLTEELNTLKFDADSSEAEESQQGTIYDFQLTKDDEVKEDPSTQRVSDNKYFDEEEDSSTGTRIAALTNDNIIYLTRIKDLTTQLHKEQIKNKSLQEENDTLRTEESSFKKTILAAQNFADNIKKSAEEEAQRILEQAQNDVDIYLREMDEKAKYLPGQIDELEKRKFDVRQELKTVLEGYMAVLDLENLSDELNSVNFTQSAKSQAAGQNSSTK